MSSKNAVQYLNESCEDLRNIKDNLTEAYSLAKIDSTKIRIKNQLQNIQSSIQECESIANILKQH